MQANTIKLVWWHRRAAAVVRIVRRPEGSDRQLLTER